MLATESMVVDRMLSPLGSEMPRSEARKRICNRLQWAVLTMELWAGGFIDQASAGASS